MCFRCSKEPSHWDWKVLENKMPWNVLKNLSKVLKNLWILLFSMVLVCYYSGFTHWQYLNIEGFLEESLKSNLPWNMLDNLSKALRSSCILLLSMGLVCYYSGFTQYLNIEGLLEVSLKSNLLWNMPDNISWALRSSCILLLSMGIVCYLSGFTQCLNIEDFLEKSLKIKSALKSTVKSL